MGLRPKEMPSWMFWLTVWATVMAPFLVWAGWVLDPRPFDYRIGTFAVASGCAVITAQLWELRQAKLWREVARTFEASTVIAKSISAELTELQAEMRKSDG